MIPGFFAGGAMGAGAGATVSLGPDYLYAHVSALLHMDGADASTTFTDQTGKAWATNGNAQIDTAQSKFGGASGLFDGSGDFLKHNHHPSFSMSGDFTVEAWVRPDVNTSQRTIVSKRGTGVAENEWSLVMTAAGKAQFTVFEDVTGTGFFAVGTTTLAINTWHHIAGVRNGTDLLIFVNGVLEATAAGPAAVNVDVAPLYIGRDSDTNTTRDWDGWMDEVRITQGVAWYTANFTPAAAAFPNPAIGAWSSITDPRAIPIGTTGIAFTALTMAGRASVFSADAPYETFTETVLRTGVSLDDHDNAALLKRDSDGKILAMQSSHNGAQFYGWISSVTDSVSAFGLATDHDSTMGVGPYTYANLHQLTGMVNDPIMVFARSGTAPSWTMHYASSTDGGATFGAMSALLGPNRPYFKSVTNGGTRIDFAVTTGHPGEVAACSIYHFYYDNGSWYDSSGVSIGSPPFDQTTDLTQVYDGSTYESLVWDIQVDGSGNPAIVFAVFVTTTDHRYYYAKWNGSSWVVNQICTAGTYLYADATQPYYSGGVCIDPDNVNRTFASRESGGNWNIYCYTTANSGASWAETQLTSGDGMRFRPFVVPNRNVLLYIEGQYDTYTSYNTVVAARTIV